MPIKSMCWELNPQCNRLKTAWWSYLGHGISPSWTDTAIINKEWSCEVITFTSHPVSSPDAGTITSDFALFRTVRKLMSVLYYPLRCSLSSSPDAILCSYPWECALFLKCAIFHKNKTKHKNTTCAWAQVGVFECRGMLEGLEMTRTMQPKPWAGNTAEAFWTQGFPLAVLGILGGLNIPFHNRSWNHVWF